MDTRKGSSKEMILDLVNLASMSSTQAKKERSGVAVAEGFRL